MSAFDIHELVYENLHLQEHEVVMIQIDGIRRHVYIKFKDPQRMQAILTATQGQEDFRHENGEISKVRIEAVGLGMRRVRVASLPPEVEEKTSKMALGAFGEIHDIQPEIWSNAYRYRVCSTCGKHVTGQTYPFTCGGGRVQSTNIIRGAADNLSQLQRTGSSSNCVPAQTAGESGRHTGNHGIMGGNGAEWAQFKHHILNRATDMAAPENMEAETLQEPDSAPTHQKNEIDQRGVEAIPIKEEERVLEPTMDTAGERPHVEGRRRTLSNDHAPPSWERLEGRMETSQEQQPVRRQPDNEECGRPVRDNMDVEGVTLEWSIGGKEEVRLAPQDRMQKTAKATSPERPKKLKIDRQDETPPVRRRSRSKTKGITSF